MVKDSINMNKTLPFLRLLSVFLIMTLLPTFNKVWPVNAQSPEDTSWTTPVNLSNSGLTSLPSIVSDQNGTVHVVWQDETLGTMYSQLKDGQWSPAAAVKSPFELYAPTFVDGGNYIHAFWLDSNRALYHSRVTVANINAGSWEKAKRLATGVEDFKVVYQPENALHLVYLTSLEDSRNQAGIYYLRSMDGGVRFEAAKPIYTSRYLRDVDPSMFNVDVAVTVQDGQQAVYSVWNNPALKRVYLSRSLDNGVNWETPFEVDGPSDANATVSPFNPMLTASGTELLVIWQSNLQSGFACSQYYQESNDGGATWGERSRMLTEFVGCPQENVLLKVDEELTLLQTTIRDEVYLVAWNGEAWSKAFLQPPLASFNDPYTNEPVTFRCRQSVVNIGTTLFVAGCNQDGNKDIWVNSRLIGGVESWFPSTTLWNDPIMVVESPDEISNVQAVVDNNGVFHAFWLQVDPSVDAANYRSIYYVRFLKDSLTQPARVLVSPDKMVEDFSVTYDSSRDRLAIVWSTGTTGDIYYSWADTSRAASTFEWAKPLALPKVSPLVKSPNLLITPDGTIYVAFAIPVNEDRGIYLLSSSDGGATWGEALQVYGVVEPEWQAIDNPKLASTGDEVLHVIWVRNRIFGDVGLVGLYYSRSVDRGRTWSNPQVVSNELIQGAWILDGASEGVHRFWLSSVGNETSFYHDASMDQGVNWLIQDNLTGFGELPGIASPYMDPVGMVNFAQAVANSPENLVINHQQSNGGRWAILDSLALGSAGLEEVTSLSAQELPTGRLVVAYTFQEAQPVEGELPFRLYLAAQSVEAIQTTATAEVRLATAVQQTQIPVLTAETTKAVLTPKPTESITPPTPYAPVLTVVAEDQPLSIDTTTGLVLSGGLALVVVAVFFLFTRLRRS